MKRILQLLILLMLPVLGTSQNITWQDVSSSYEFPEGLKLFHGTIAGNSTFFACYYEVDLNKPNIAVRPYLKPSNTQVNAFSAEVGAYGAINGGFFTGSSSVSSIIYPGEVPARNLISVNRTVGGVSRTYPLIRPIFALNNDRSLSTEWVYHHSYNFDDIYVYQQPLPYQCDDPNPLPVPVKENGTQYEDIAYGIGGGPMLIKNGAVLIDYCEGVWWGSGVLLTDYRPRTAVGYTANKKVILFVTNSMMIQQVAETLLGLGCVGAMNLDGGGSTAMAVGGQSLYDQARAVPSILAVVHSDSLNIPQVPLFEKTIDTEDDGVYFQGGWFNTANPGSWGSPSRLHALGTHDDFYHFPLNLPAAGEYEVYAWWTAHSNRATNTPFFITHAGGVSEVAMNQSQGGSMWNYVGKYQFAGNAQDAVRLTAGATTNQYVVADGIRIVSYDPLILPNYIVSIEPVDNITVYIGTSLEDALLTLSSHTTILDAHNQSHQVALSWTSPGYNNQAAGEYEAVGSFVLPEGVLQTDPPTPLEVQALITVLDNTSIALMELEKFKIFPNPNTGNFRLEGSFVETITIELLTPDGKLVYKDTASGSISKEIDLGSNARGIYFLRISSPQASKVIKVVVG